MDELGYILWRLVGRWILGVAAILLAGGVIYGLIIGDVQKGVRDVYFTPVEKFISWRMEKKKERIERRMEGIFDTASEEK